MCKGNRPKNMNTWIVIPSIFIRSGPLILLPKFHYSMVRHCSMHNVNLGIAAVANGSALLLIWNSSPFFWQLFGITWVIMINPSFPMNQSWFEASIDTTWILWRSCNSVCSWPFGDSIQRLQSLVCHEQNSVFTDSIHVASCNLDKF